MKPDPQHILRCPFFFDRDGIFNIDHGYVHRKEQWQWVPGILDLLRYLHQNGHPIFIITNQSGISRGYFSETDFLNLTQWMVTVLDSEGIQIKKLYFCPHQDKDHCLCRKPKPGLFLNAKTEFKLSLEDAWMIGDAERDIIASKEAGVGHSVLIKADALDSQADFIFPSIEILKKNIASLLRTV